VIRCLAHRKQEVKHLLCPGLFFLLADKETVSQEMSPTQTVRACVMIIAGLYGRPTSSPEGGQHIVAEQARSIGTLFMLLAP
jgi:hypothetical protein